MHAVSDHVVARGGRSGLFLYLSLPHSLEKGPLNQEQQALCTHSGRRGRDLEFRPHREERDKDWVPQTKGGDILGSCSPKQERCSQVRLGLEWERSRRVGFCIVSFQLHAGYRE